MKKNIFLITTISLFIFVIFSFTKYFFNYFSSDYTYYLISIELLIYSAGAYLCFRASKKYSRFYLAYIGVFLVFSAIADVFYEILSQTSLEDNEINISDIGYFLAYTSLITALIKMNSTFKAVKLKRNIVTDLLTFSFTTSFMLLAWTNSFEDSFIRNTITFLYLFFDIILVVILGMFFRKFKRNLEDRKVIVHIILAISTYTIGDTIYFVFEGNRVFLYIADALYILTGALIGVASYLQSTSAELSIFKYVKSSLQKVNTSIYFIWLYSISIVMLMGMWHSTYFVKMNMNSNDFAIVNLLFIGLFIRLWVNLKHLSSNYRTKERELMYDKLTNLYKREVLSEIDDVIMSFKRSLYPIALMLVDISGMSSFNEKYGAAAGDNIIKEFCNNLINLVNDSGIIVRYDGDRFLCLVPGAEFSEKRFIYNKIKSELESFDKNTDGKEFSITYVEKIICEGSILNHLKDLELKITEKKMFKSREFKSLVQTNRNLVEQQQLDVLKSFLKIVELKDMYTENHSIRVADYSKAIASRMGLSDTEIMDIYNAGILHDIGKILIPHEVLNKQSKLTESEMDVMRTHPKIGYEIISSIGILRQIASYVRYHHERFDGNSFGFGGYPGEVTGSDIPLGARIICVADSFDAMTTDRSYRRGMPFEKALSILSEEKGKQFDGEIVDVFVDIVNEQIEVTA